MPEITVTLPGSIRSKKNSKRIFAMGRFKKVLPSKAYEGWEKEAREAMAVDDLFCIGGFVALSCPVHVEARIYYKGPRPDLSGALESIGDAMQGILWADDGLIESWDGSRLFHDLKEPRTEITLRWGMPKLMLHEFATRNRLTDTDH